MHTRYFFDTKSLHARISLFAQNRGIIEHEALLLVIVWLKNAFPVFTCLLVCRSPAILGLKINGKIGPAQSHLKSQIVNNDGSIEVGVDGIMYYQKGNASAFLALDKYSTSAPSCHRINCKLLL